MTQDRLIVRRRIGDIETPVSAMLKLGPETPGSFLFESIHGGERLGRYSFVGVEPLKWFRVKGGTGALRRFCGCRTSGRRPNFGPQAVCFRGTRHDRRRRPASHGIRRFRLYWLRHDPVC